MSNDSGNNPDKNSRADQSQVDRSEHSSRGMGRGTQTAILVGVLAVLFGIFMHYQVTTNPNDPYAKCKSIFETNKVQCRADIAMKRMRGY